MSRNPTIQVRKSVTTPVNQENLISGLEHHDIDDDSDSSEYHSFDDEDDDDGSTNDRAARERERQLVLEAAGLIVQTDATGPLRRRSTKRRPAPAPGRNRRTDEDDLATQEKVLPPIPQEDIETQFRTITPELMLSHEASLDDAYARYEAFKNRQVTPNRLSVVSIESAPSASGSPGTTSNVRESEGGRYSGFLNFLRSKTPDIDVRETRRKSAGTLNISAPINIQTSSAIHQNPEEEFQHPDGASFGISWVSLVDKTVLDEIPARERKRQGLIFELINTEIAYVRDLQLIVEVYRSFYSLAGLVLR